MDSVQKRFLSYVCDGKTAGVLFLACDKGLGTNSIWRTVIDHSNPDMSGMIALFDRLIQEKASAARMMVESVSFCSKEDQQVFLGFANSAIPLMDIVAKARLDAGNDIISDVGGRFSAEDDLKVKTYAAAYGAFRALLGKDEHFPESPLDGGMTAFMADAFSGTRHLFPNGIANPHFGTPPDKNPVSNALPDWMDGFFLNDCFLAQSEGTNFSNVLADISRGCDIDTKDAFGFSALHYAAANPKGTKAMTHLLGLGARVVPDRNGHTIMDYSRTLNRGQDTFSLIESALLFQKHGEGLRDRNTQSI